MPLQPLLKLLLTQLQPQLLRRLPLLPLLPLQTTQWLLLPLRLLLLRVLVQLRLLLMQKLLQTRPSLMLQMLLLLKLPRQLLTQMPRLHMTLQLLPLQSL
jgi:hypothetical protein